MMTKLYSLCGQKVLQWSYKNELPPTEDSLLKNNSAQCVSTKQFKNYPPTPPFVCQTSKNVGCFPSPSHKKLSIAFGFKDNSVLPTLLLPYTHTLQFATMIKGFHSVSIRPVYWLAQPPKGRNPRSLSLIPPPQTHTNTNFL